MSSASKRTAGFAAAIWAVLLLPPTAAAIELTPFATRNQNPLVQIYGLPPAEPATLLDRGRLSTHLTLDIANNFASSATDDEAVALDGETYRSNIALRYGVNERFEIGLDIPFVSHAGGFLDGFIEGWHDTFGLPEGGRKQSSRDQLAYRYARDGQPLVELSDSSAGFGDLRLSAAWQMVRTAGEDPSAAALRLSLKLPTGDSDKLLGSGSTDLALSLAGQRALPTEERLAVFASLGALLTTDGEVLEEQRRNLAGFGSLGFGWAACDWLSLKIQLDGHTALYKDSSLTEINAHSLQLVLGGALQLAEGITLDLAVGEDIVVDSAPDVVFHLGLRIATF
ncbi:MAG: DUF3187 family protein [Desulfuromonadales bacterium]